MYRCSGARGVIIALGGLPQGWFIGCVCQVFCKFRWQPDGPGHRAKHDRTQSAIGPIYRASLLTLFPHDCSIWKDISVQNFQCDGCVCAGKTHRTWQRLHVSLPYWSDPSNQAKKGIPCAYAEREREREREIQIVHSTSLAYEDESVFTF